MNITWPRDHRFCFTVFDDTDWVSVKNVKPVYDLLYDLGMRTTKSVWVFTGHKTPIHPGMTLEDKEYLEWIRSLKQQGFEIGLHNSSAETSTREITTRALERFISLFGDQPICHTNHLGCLDAIYWGDARFSGQKRMIYNLLTGWRKRDISRGHEEQHPVFWGDLCRQRVSYVRNFVFNDLNSLAVCPEMPYHDAAKPFVNFWFASSDGGNLEIFIENFTVEKIDRLVEQRGACIAYVHFAAGFVRDGQVNPKFRERLEYIASKGGWFAPVSEVLDYLRAGGDRVSRTISQKSLDKLETLWLIGKILSQVVLRRQ